MFDGDTGNGVGIHSKEATEEIEQYLKTREAWVQQGGSLRGPLAYDTIELVVRNLCGRFDHVVNVEKGSIRPQARTET